jgi:RNA polymerase sigma factor (sigma-70 family)
VVTTGEQAADGEAARKRAAVEMVARHEGTLRRTAQRFSICAEDAEDALQRALEILLTKAPTTDPRELIRWMQTVTKHEALALRRERERLLGGSPRSPAGDGGAPDWVSMLPADGEGPDEQVEQRETIARSREALKTLKRAELRALSLLAEGYSYAEIGEITGFSPTKVNRVLAEGRERFRRVLSDSEDGRRCRELRPLLSAFCDDEVSPREAAVLREHLRACPSCRATMRAYRATPGTVAALLPLPPAIPLLGRLRDLFAGAKGAGTATMAKGLAVCAGAAGGAACVAAGVLPGPLDGSPGEAKPPAREAAAIQPAPVVRSHPKPSEPRPKPRASKAEERNATAATQAATVKYTPPAEPAPAPKPAPAPPPSEAPAPSPSGGGAGEFGP